MRKVGLLLIMCFLILAGVVHAELKVSINPDSVVRGGTIRVTLSGDSYYKYIYIYDGNNKYQGRTTLICDRSRCSGEKVFNFLIPVSFGPGNAYIGVYDYSKKPGSSKIVGWNKFYFSVSKSDKKINLVCTKQVQLKLHDGKCDPNNCYNQNMSYSGCYTYPNTLWYKIRGYAGKSKEICEQTYGTGCSDSPRCAKGYEEKSSKGCEAEKTNVRCEIDYKSNVPNDVICNVDYKGQKASCKIPAAPSGYHLCDPEPKIMIEKPEPNKGFQPVSGLSGSFGGIECSEITTAYNTNYYFVNCEKPVTLCKDSDGGLNKYKKGVASYSGYEYADSCAKGGESSQWSGGVAKKGDVIEYACYDENGEFLCGQSYCHYKVMSCPNGCKDGACVDMCAGINSDAERDSCYMKLAIEGDSSVCSLIVSDFVRKSCYGLDSKNCTDSDGGKNYYVKGAAQEGYSRSLDVCFSVKNGSSTQVSYCTGPQCFLSEQYCSIEGRAMTRYECPNGCQDGACIKAKPVCVDYDYSDSEGPYTPGDDIYKKSFVEYGNHYNLKSPTGQLTDYCYSKDQLAEFRCHKKEEGSFEDMNLVTCKNGCKEGACVKEAQGKGLIAYYNFDANPQTDLGIVEDNSGNGHKGTFYTYEGGSGNPNKAVEGKVNSALSFDGKNDYVSVSDNDAWTFRDEFTIALRVKIESEDQYGAALVSHDEGGGNKNKWIFLRAGKNSGAPAEAQGRTAFHINNPASGSDWVYGNSWSPNPNEWYHIAITKKGNIYTFYRNGIEDGSDTSSIAIPNSAAPLEIGKAESLFKFDGVIDELKIWNRALSAEEVKEEYKP